MNEQAEPLARRRLSYRVASGFALALAIAFSTYLLLNLSRPTSAALGSFWFLILLPALLCALICYIGDPDRTRSAGFYWGVPLVLAGAVVVGSVFVLHEGVICVLMLSPLWLGSGWAGAFLLCGQRRKPIDPRTFESSFLVIPIIVGLIEPAIPVPHDQVLLTRTVVVHATPAEIWPFAVSNRSIGADEGRWTITHNVIGLPRPSATTIVGAGVGAVRTAYWGRHINFEEDITEWSPGRRLGWRFAFNNTSLQDYTDQHISPDGAFLKIESGDYTLRQTGPDTTQLTLETRYLAKTHLNLYARLWGEFLLGDTQDNILTILKNRAEAAHARAAHGPQTVVANGVQVAGSGPA
ncbi:MAG TPA: SRPBCC family protein [Caulobacteraceae bacterium]|jgi:hypothetical protein